MFPYIASTLLYRLHRRETQPALLSTAALSRKVESKLLDRAGSGSGHIQYWDPTLECGVASGVERAAGALDACRASLDARASSVSLMYNTLGCM